MTYESQSEALLIAFQEGFRDIIARYPGSGQKVKLKLVRKVLGLSQREFAEEFSIPYPTVRNWELESRGEPAGAAKVLIDILAEDPVTVRKLVAQTKKHNKDLREKEDV